ncbi:MAG: hypothetical protein WAK56_02055, partial [Candidatus Sulfotelmatobacter sp.]
MPAISDAGIRAGELLSTGTGEEPGCIWTGRPTGADSWGCTDWAGADGAGVAVDAGVGAIGAGLAAELA